MYLVRLEHRHRPFSHFLGCTKGRFRDFELFFCGCTLDVSRWDRAWLLRYFSHSALGFCTYVWLEGMDLLSRNYSEIMGNAYVFRSYIQALWPSPTNTILPELPSASWLPSERQVMASVWPYNPIQKHVSDARQIIICEKADCYTVSSDRDSVDI